MLEQIAPANSLLALLPKGSMFGSLGYYCCIGMRCIKGAHAHILHTEHSLSAILTTQFEEK